MFRLSRLPEEERAYSGLSVKVNGEKADLSVIRVSAMPFDTVWPGCQRPLWQTELCPMLHVEADETLHFEIDFGMEIVKAVVRPLSKNVKAESCGSIVRFDIEKCGAYTVEINGFHHALHLFVDAPETFGITENDKNVLYFGPGVHHVGGVYLHTGQTVYVDRDAVVYGAFSALCCENVRICGYGIIDGSWEKRRSGQGFYLTDFERRLPGMNAEQLKNELKEQEQLWGNVRFLNCKNVRLEGVTLRDSASFSVIPAACENIVIDNVKTVGMWRYNSDGIDIINCSGVTVRRCFLRDFDDCMVIKGVMGYDRLPNKDINISECVIWCDWGRALEIGAETCATEYANIRFTDCDVIRGCHICLDIQHHNHALIHDVSYENVRIEYPYDTLCPVYQNTLTDPYDETNRDFPPVAMGIYIYNMGLFCKDYRNGCVRNIRYKDIAVTVEDNAPYKVIELMGLDKEHDISGVSFENITLNGSKIDNKAIRLLNEYVSDVTIR